MKLETTSASLASKADTPGQGSHEPWMLDLIHLSSLPAYSRNGCILRMYDFELSLDIEKKLFPRLVLTANSIVEDTDTWL